jgi:hypothetical protein
VSNNQYRIEYNHVVGDWLYGIYAYAYNGPRVSGGASIAGGQMLEFRDPASLSPLSGVITLAPVFNHTTPVNLSQTGQFLDSYGIAHFDDETLTGDVTAGTVNINATYSPVVSSDPNKVKCSQQGSIQVVTTTTTTTTSTSTTTTTTSTTTPSINPTSYYWCHVQTFLDSNCTNMINQVDQCVLGSTISARGGFNACWYIWAFRKRIWALCGGTKNWMNRQRTVWRAFVMGL